MAFMKIIVLCAAIVGLASGCGKSNDVSTTQMGGAIQGKALSLTGSVSTLAGSAGTAGSVDDIGASARFNELGGITTDGQNLYVADSVNSTIRKVNIATGTVTTLAGTAGAIGYIDGVGAAARFDRPADITTDGSNLYVTDANNRVIRKVVIATGAVSTLAGTAGNIGSADGIGGSASFFMPLGITTDGTNLYITDIGNETIRKVEIASGVVTTIAGTAGIMGSSDGSGGAARFLSLHYITTDGTNAYVTDGRTIRKVVLTTGNVTTLAGLQNRTSLDPTGSVDGVGASASFEFPAGITTDGSNLYV